jgi:hypothetical protein
MAVELCNLASEVEIADPAASEETGTGSPVSSASETRLDLNVIVHVQTCTNETD